MNAEERRAYFQGARAFHEAVGIKLTTDAPPAHIMNAEHRLLITNLLLEAHAYLTELAAWADEADDATPPPHPRVARIRKATT